VLASTELAGAPTEYFDRNQMDEFFKRWGITTIDEYIPALLARKTSPNGVFGLKAFFPQLQELGRSEVGDVFPNLHCIHITRRDRVRQAVSYWRAIQTEQWASDHPVRNPRPVRFDAGEIRALVDRIEREEQAWKSFFEAGFILPVRIAYEQMVETLEETVLRVLSFLGVEVPAGFELPPPTIQRQADELSEEWVRRYELNSGGPTSRGATE
jgi:LPS sulfotransferase NodH